MSIFNDDYYPEDVEEPDYGLGETKRPERRCKHCGEIEKAAHNCLQEQIAYHEQQIVRLKKRLEEEK